VGTSIALFIGRAAQGPLNTPVRCLNFSTFENTFSTSDAGGDLVRAVRLFFANGGSECYVVRIAKGAAPSDIQLQNEAGAATLTAKALSAGVVGDTIRLNVNYNTALPESTFNLGVFRWTRDPLGNFVQTDPETWPALSMDPKHPRYAVDFVNQNSTLISLTDSGVGAAAKGSSASGRPVATADWPTVIGKGVSTNHFQISVDGGPFVDIDLKSLDFGAAPLQPPATATLKPAIEALINAKLQPGAAVAVDFTALPDNTTYLTVSSTNGDVLIQPGASDDVAVPLMLGTAQGGVEVSRYADARPAATGLVFNIKQLAAFAGLNQTAFDTITLDGSKTVPLGNLLKTAGANAKMYQDANATSPTKGHDGVREKWNIIAKAVNDARQTNPASMPYVARVWGSRLALLPAEGPDRQVGSIATSGGDGIDIGGDFFKNVRYYSLGAGAAVGFQAGGHAGSNGQAPGVAEYQATDSPVSQEVDLFNLMVLPTDEGIKGQDLVTLWGWASGFCHRRRAVLLMDAPQTWKKADDAVDPAKGVASLRTGLVKDYSALFFPWVTVRENGVNRDVGPSGAIAGLIARIDSAAGGGVWKAPAGTDADIRGIVGLSINLSNEQNGLLNPHAVNTLRRFPVGIVNWGARTMDGDDLFSSQWKYLNIRRLALYIEESLYRGTQWAVFQGNDEPLWAQLRLNVTTFMQALFRQGAFQGISPGQAYFVKCDSETTTENDRNLGRVNIVVGFAPLKPAEFVVIQIQQMAGPAGG
jgi:phage tail sheath protein FI